MKRSENLSATVTPELKGIVRRIAAENHISESTAVEQLMIDGLKYRYPKQGLSLKFKDEMEEKLYEEFRRHKHSGGILDFLNQHIQGSAPFWVVVIATLVLLVLVVVLDFVMLHQLA